MDSLKRRILTPVGKGDEAMPLDPDLLEAVASVPDGISGPTPQHRRALDVPCACQVRSVPVSPSLPFGHECLRNRWKERLHFR